MNYSCFINTDEFLFFYLCRLAAIKESILPVSGIARHRKGVYVFFKVQNLKCTLPTTYLFHNVAAFAVLVLLD